MVSNQPWHNLLRSTLHSRPSRHPQPHSFSPRFSSSSPNLGARPPRKLLRRTLITAGVVGVGYGVDHYYYADAFSRTIRTGIFGVTMAIDFKLNFKPDNSASIDALHERAAKRIHEVCTTNGGLYIKLAQSLAVQAAILPKPYREAFANIFDGAPGVDWDEVVKVYYNEFGRHPDEDFDRFSRVPIASASIAQVHKARLKRKAGEREWREDEGWVAVKIRKPAIVKQIEWDLFAYKALLYSYEKLFDLPVSFVADYVALQMRKEIDLHHEAENAMRTRANIEKESSLRDKVNVPQVYWDWTGKSVMTADFVNACRLTDRTSLDRLGINYKDAMDTATNLFAAMTFKFGFLHCDPHPGNILVRRKEDGKVKGGAEVVIIDHGLYIDLPEEFRIQYCELWRSLFVGDIPKIQSIAQSWGIAKEHSDMFASMTLLRPHRLGKGKKKKEEEGGKKELSKYESQTGLKDRLRSMLENEKDIPRELIFLTRGLRMMQANNQSLGSPSNRINILAHWSLSGLELSTPQHQHRTIKEASQIVIFQITLFVIDVGFVLTKFRQWVLGMVGKVTGNTKEGEGFEDLLQKQVTDMARTEFGVELDDSAFKG